MCIICAFGFTGLLLFKDLYFYTWLEKKDTIIYSIPLVFLFFYWIKFRLDDKHLLHLNLFIVDTVVVLLAAARILGLLYHSGHVLFLLYTFITTKNTTYRILCIPMILITIYYKESSFDILSPTIATLLGFIFISLRKKYIDTIEGR